MGKKLLALALIGAAAAYLFRTKQGNELRKQAMGSANKAVDKLRVKFQHANGHLTEALDSFS